MPDLQLDTLDSYQRAAATSQAARLAISAPAGSGKTRVLIERVAWLVRSQAARPKNILVLTFAKKAAREIADRLAAQDPSKVDLALVQVRTFHAWALQLIRRSHTNVGHLILEQEKHDLLWRIGCSLFADGRYRTVVQHVCQQENWSQPFLLRQLIDIQTRLTQSGVDLEDPRLRLRAEQNQLARLVFAHLFNYQTMLKRHGASDFSLLVASALRQRLVHPPSYQHVLVDEAQDAAANELALIKKYCGRAESRTWVGDPNQSLYGWRGARGSIPDAGQQLQLKYNYRSTADIVRTVNRFLKQSSNAQLILPSRPSGLAVQVIAYARFGEDALCSRLIAELLQQGFQQADIVILARAHLPLDSLQQTRSRFPKVLLATVHAYKGLESPVVIIINAAQNRFGFPAQSKGGVHPLISEFAGYDAVREERNIFYVALTRARDRLVICVPAEQPAPFTQPLTGKSVRRVTLARTYP